MRMAAHKDIEKSLITILLEVDWNAWAHLPCLGKDLAHRLRNALAGGNDFSAGPHICIRVFRQFRNVGPRIPRSSDSEVGGIFVTRSRGFCDPVSRIACVEVRPGLEFRRI